MTVQPQPLLTLARQTQKQSSPLRKLRLIKVLVQPVFVIDDGDNITELEHPPVAIPAAEWPTYSSERFPQEVAAWQEELNTPEE